VYRNSLTPSKLFGITLLLFGLSGLLLWGVGFMDTEGSTVFDAGSLIVLGLSVGLLVLSLLFLWRVKGVRILMSILLHLAALALLATLPFTVPAMETMLNQMILVILILLGVGLLFLAVLVLHSDAMQNDFAVGRERIEHRKRFYLTAAAGGVLLFTSIAAWRIVPLLVAQPTITVDYLAQANEVSKPADYDPNRNAALYYEKIFAQFVALPEPLKDKHRSWPTDLSPDELKALEEWAPVNDPAWPALAQAARCSYWWHELKSTTGAMSNIQVPDLDHIRDFTRGALLLAKYKATRGDMTSALQLLTDVHATGMHLADGLTLIEGLTGAAICQLSCDALLAVLSQCHVPADDLRTVLGTLSRQASKGVMPRFPKVGHLYEQDCIQRLFTDDGNGNGRLIPA
jgi:hypothetical protein